MNVQTFKLIDGKVLVHILLDNGEKLTLQKLTKQIEMSESSPGYVNKKSWDSDLKKLKKETEKGNEPLDSYNYT